jgi:hypothetical protein
MMRTLKIKNAVELIGIAAIVGSLVFVGMQMRQVQDIAVVDTYGELSQSNIELIFEVGEKIDVWKKGLNGDRLTEEEQDTFFVLAAAVMEYNQRVWIRWLRIGPIDPAHAASRFAYALYVYPGLRREWESIKQFESSMKAARGFGQNSQWELAVNEYLAQYDREKPSIPNKKRYIFWGF